MTLLQVIPSTTIYGLVITWGPPSGSNYPTPVTYRVRYRERPSSGPPGSWSSPVVRSATQREYTTPTLKQGTRYEVEVWAVTSIGNGISTTETATTYQCKITLHLLINISLCDVTANRFISYIYCLANSSRTSDITPSEAVNYHIWTGHNMGTTFWEQLSNSCHISSEIS